MNTEKASETSLTNNDQVNRVNSTQSYPNTELEVCDPNDPFDPVNVRLSQDTISGGKANKLLTHVPVRKPNKLDFNRVHPDPNYRVVSGLLEDKENREVYLISPDYYPDVDPAICGSYTLYLTINRQGILFLWPVRLPGADGRTNNWHISATTAAEIAMAKWVRISPNMALGAYNILEAEGLIPEPQWPKDPIRKFLRVAFEHKLIDGPEHPIIQRIFGRL